ncbi:MAG: hypothetical protein LBT93_03565 [Treponema sp.]|jgi:hypothetical protein|nr:hypothetical protein [Treponema sp.]
MKKDWRGRSFQFVRQCPILKEDISMSDISNPYQSPQTENNPASSLVNRGVLTENMIFYLRGASPWLRFIGVLAYIGCGLVTAAGLAIMIGFPGITNSLFFLEMSSQGEVWGRSLGLVYIIIGIIGFFPARFTYNFGAKIRVYLQSNAEQDLELAFKNNKSLWKFNGILAIIYLAIVPIALVILILALIGSAAF